jgi:cytochrome c oxidase subunit 2
MGFHRRLTTICAAAFAALAGALASAPAASADFFSPESGGSPNANHVDTLYWITYGCAAVVFAGVCGVLAWSLIRYRARRGAVAAQIHGNTRLEIGWTVGAAVLVVVLAVVTFVMLPGIRNPPNSSADGFTGVGYGKVPAIGGPGVPPALPPNGKALKIDVNGQQYIWRYTYPDNDDNPLNNVFSYEEMVVPTNTTVVLAIRSQDVAHSWWIPKLGGKADAIPGYVNSTWFKISKPGINRGQCAELCGRNHANMLATVRAVPPAQYAAWLKQQQADIRAADQAAAVSRKRLDANPTATP